MNHTTNYNLNQWDALDKVQRTDFNADNAKIDAAIHAVDGRVDGLAGSKADKSALNTLTARVTAAEAANLWVKLADVTLDESQHQVDLPLSQYDMGQFAAVKVYGQMTGGQFMVRLDNNASSAYSWGASASRNYLFYGLGRLFRMELSGFGSSCILGRMIYGGDGVAGDDYGTYNTAGAAVRSINLVGRDDGNIFKGSRITAYGLRL